ncbi:DUF1365 domain-containing protein [Elioraea rosea]|uniref:DUF1365 domain-containing protein n=1 Tax=Elioraea rosea TaxID=2492390 RepID=UPI001182F45D|nr:DUF1365 domain-containing protein [Elioraea rosea]
MSGLDGEPALLYRMRVMHARHQPFAHRFEYRIWTLLLDIDRIGELDARSRLFAADRRGIVSFRSRDHGARDGSPLRPWVEGALARAGLAECAARIRLLAMPRILGYVFNPISIYFCDREDGTPGAVLYEVKNTFGDQHAYIAPLAGAAPWRHAAEKVMHVSPFIDMQCRYGFTLSRPADRFAMAIDQCDGEGAALLTATMAGRGVPMTDRALAAALAALPFVTAKTIAAIHWEALRLWRKGARFHSRPAPPEPPVTVAA